MGASNSAPRPAAPPSLDDPATVSRVAAARFAMLGDVASLQSHLRRHPELPLSFGLSDADRCRASLQWTDAEGDAVWFTARSTLAHVAAIRGQLCVLEWLLHSLGGAALIHATDARGSTPLLAAAADGQIAIVRRLLQLGAQINSVNSDRVSALHLAAAQGHAELVSLLLRVGADAALTNNAGQTAEQWASEVASLIKRQATMDAFRAFRSAGSPVAPLSSHERAQLQAQQKALAAGVRSCKVVAFRLAKLALLDAGASDPRSASSAGLPLIDRASLESLLYHALSAHSAVVLYLAGARSEADAMEADAADATETAAGSACYRQLHLCDSLLPRLCPFLDEPAEVITDEVDRALAAFMHTHKQISEHEALLNERINALERRVAELSAAILPASASSSVGSPNLRPRPI